MNKRNAVVQKSGSPAPERPQFSLIDKELLKSRIYTIRGLKVMLDADLTMISAFR